MSSPRNDDPLSKSSLSIPFVANPLARYLLRVIGGLMAVGSILVIVFVGTIVNNEVAGFAVGILVLALGVFLRWMGVRRRPKNV